MRNKDFGAPGNGGQYATSARSEPQASQSLAPAERTCGECFGLVDADGDTTGDCASWGKDDDCEECGACYCDGSC